MAPDGDAIEAALQTAVHGGGRELRLGPPDAPFSLLLCVGIAVLDAKLAHILHMITPPHALLSLPEHLIPAGPRA